MSDWKLNGNDLCPQGWQVSRITRGAPWDDNAVLVANDDFTGTLPTGVSYGTICTITHPDGTVLLVGYAEPISRTATLSESRSFRVNNLWSRLAMIPYRQQFKAAEFVPPTLPATEPTEVVLVDYWRAKTHLGTGAGGAALTASGVIAGVLEFAASQCDIPVAMGTGFDGYMTAPIQFEGMCSEAINTVLRLNANVFPYATYADGGASYNFVVSDALTPTSVEFNDGDASVQVQGVPALTLRSDLVAAGVVFTMERVGSFIDSQLMEIKREVAPSGVDEFTPGVLCYTLSLDGKEGSPSSTQSIRTRKLPGEGTSDAHKLEQAKYLLAKLPNLIRLQAIATLTPDMLHVSDYTKTVVPADETYCDAPDPPEADKEKREWSTDATKYPRELVDGQIQFWMTGIKKAPIMVSCMVGLKAPPADPALKRLFGDNGEKVHEVSIACTGTNASTRSYSGLADFGQVAAWPDYGAGPSLAELFYDQVKVAHWEGSVEIVAKTDIHPPTSVSMGQSLNIDGAGSEWGSMNAPIYAIDYAPQSGVTTISVGPPRSLSFDDIVERQRALRRGNLLPGGVAASYERKTNATPTAGGTAGLGFHGPKDAGGFMPAVMANHAFRLDSKPGTEPGTWKAVVSPGTLYWSASVMQLPALDDDADATTNAINRTVPTFTDGAFTKPVTTDTGEFWIRWDTTADGEVTAAEIVTDDPGDDVEFDSFAEVAGSYSLKIGAVDGDGIVTQELRSDVFWHGVGLKATPDIDYTSFDVVTSVDSVAIEGTMTVTSTTTPTFVGACGPPSSGGFGGSGSGGMGGSGSQSCSGTVTALILSVPHWTTDYFYVRGKLRHIKLPTAWLDGDEEDWTISMDVNSFTVV